MNDHPTIYFSYITRMNLSVLSDVLSASDEETVCSLEDRYTLSSMAGNNEEYFCMVYDIIESDFTGTEPDKSYEVLLSSFDHDLLRKFIHGDPKKMVSKLKKLITFATGKLSKNDTVNAVVPVYEGSSTPNVIVGTIFSDFKLVAYAYNAELGQYELTVTGEKQSV